VVVCGQGVGVDDVVEGADDVVVDDTVDVVLDADDVELVVDDVVVVDAVVVVADVFVSALVVLRVNTNGISHEFLVAIGVISNSAKG